MAKAPLAFRFAAIAVDVVVFGMHEGTLHVLTDIVDRPPHYDHVPGFPGGLIDAKETADDAVARHLKDKVGLKSVYTEQLYTFSALDRDKRNRVISIAYLGLVPPSVVASYTHPTGRFIPVAKVPSKFAYDHKEMLATALARLRGKLAYTNIAQFLLPKEFTLTELQEVYEVVMGNTVDKRNFRKKILALDLVRETGNKQEGVKNRPALLYSFKRTSLQELSPII